MPFNTFSHLRLSGISAVVPQNEIKLEDELEYFDNNIKKLERTKKMIGLDRRRVADDNVTAADLCQQAAENLFEGMNIDRSSIDALIFISQGPDHAIPATACILQHKLGLSKNTAAFDVNQGCTAYTYGLWLSGSLVESGACKRVLLLVGEAAARFSDPKNRIVTPIFGDCGTASLIEYSEKKNTSYFSLGTDGSGAEALMIPAGHARFPVLENQKNLKTFLEPIEDANGNPWYMHRTFMDGGAVFNFTMDVVPEHIFSLLEYAGLTQEKIDWLILHQANKQIANALALKTGFSKEKTPTETVSKYGNQAGASLPSVICDQIKDIVSEGSATVLLSGFGVGLSWASVILQLDHIWCSGVREFINPGNLPTREEMTLYWQTKMKNNGKQEESN